MFLRKEVKKVKTGTTQVVPFCKDCDSQNIETIQTCKDCGSHDITSDWMDERSVKHVYEDKTFYVYKCDNCGKEFDGLEIDRFITFLDGVFEPFKYEDEDCENKLYLLDMDLCLDCKKKIAMKLNKEINNILQTKHVKDTVNKVIKSTHLENNIGKFNKKKTDCTKCKNYEYCTMRRDKDFCLEYDPET